MFLVVSEKGRMPVLTHSQCCARMCCLCGEKQNRDVTMSAASELLVKECLPTFSLSRKDLFYPNGLCSVCKTDLYKIKGGKQPASWGSSYPPAWGKSLKIYGVRKCGSVVEGSPDPWLCDICIHVRGAGEGSRGKEVAKKFVSRGEVAKEPETPVKQGWCKECSQVTGRGLPHPCTAASRKRNIVKLIEEKGQTEAEQILGLGLEGAVGGERKGEA